jgi:anaphase-promoting complex subunit 6
MNHLRMYREAISYYEKALALSTSVSTYAGLAYTYHLQVFQMLSSLWYSVCYFKAKCRFSVCLEMWFHHFIRLNRLLTFI